MNLRQLEAFRAIMNVGTTTQAGKLLEISQSAVSRLLGQLEKEIGFPLFHREKGRLIPTPEAIDFIDETDKTFAGFDRLKQHTRNIRNFNSGKLRVMCVPSLSHAFLPDVLSSFLTKFPELNIYFETRATEIVVDWIASGQYDLGLVTLPLEHPGVKVELLAYPKAVCILPPGHPLCSKEVIIPEDLRDHPFISIGRRHLSRFRTDEVFEKSRVPRKTTVETATAGTACALVERGFGVAIINPFTAASKPKGAIIIKPFKPDIRYEFGIIYSALQPPSRITKEFIEALREYLSEHPNLRGD